MGSVVHCWEPAQKFLCKQVGCVCVCVCFYPLVAEGRRTCLKHKWMERTEYMPCNVTVCGFSLWGTKMNTFQTADRTTGTWNWYKILVLWIVELPVFRAFEKHYKYQKNSREELTCRLTSGCLYHSCLSAHSDWLRLQNGSDISCDSERKNGKWHCYSCSAGPTSRGFVVPCPIIVRIWSTFNSRPINVYISINLFVVLCTSWISLYFLVLTQRTWYWMIK